MKEYAAGFALRGNRVVLIRKDHPPWQAGCLNGVGGHLEPGESPYNGMVREFWEEAGLRTPSPWKHFATLEGGASEKDDEAWRVYWFVVYLTQEEAIYSVTPEQIVWADVDDLPPNVRPNLHYLLQMADPQQRHDWPFHILERSTRREVNDG